MNDDVHTVEGAWGVVRDLYCQAVCRDEAVEICEIENELLFCLLGGFGITFEHGRSAYGTIRQLDPFPVIG